jgi:cyclohexa-1,5-dienecarbonyl-CoA hydratase
LIMENKVRLEFTHQSQIARITMNAPKANILDRAMMLSLAATFEKLTAQSNVKAIVLAGTGQHFSFGATIEEHLPDQISDTLADLRQLLLKMMRAAAPLIAGSPPVTTVAKRRSISVRASAGAGSATYPGLQSRLS